MTKQSDPKSDLVCDIDDTFLMNLRYEEAKEKKLGGMINSTEGVKEIQRITGLADQYFQS